MKRMKYLFFVRPAQISRLGILALLPLFPLGVAMAQEADPPARVARLSYVQGAVSLQPAGAQDWIAADLNRPMTTGDKLWSGIPTSRAELDIGEAVIRVGSNTGFAFLNLDNSIAQMQLIAGTVAVRVRELSDGQTYEIDTPNLALLLDQPGQYRVDVDDAGHTTAVRVSDGQAEAAGGGQTVSIANQQLVTFTGTDPLSTLAAPLDAPDGFDDWSYERDREFDAVASRQYVADDMVGTQDLDDNGQWQDTPDYGYVWIPAAVPVGWAPYAFGYWAWIAPWGWTWVDAAPWGFAPFHYGRWAYWHNSWCWIPGSRQGRPIYAPALVAWLGGGGVAGVGWLPLGPGEVYVPGYRVSDRYLRNVNNTNVYQNSVANSHYANRAVSGAITTVSGSVFASAQPVNAQRVRLSAAQVAHLVTTAAPPAIAPVRQSVPGGRPPAALLNRVVVARTAPPAAAAAHVRLVASPQQASRNQGLGRPLPPSAPAPAPAPARAASPVVPPPEKHVPPSNKADEHSSAPRQPSRPDPHN
jgi:hypothetical protein